MMSSGRAMDLEAILDASDSDSDASGGADLRPSSAAAAYTFHTTTNTNTTTNVLPASAEIDSGGGGEGGASRSGAIRNINGVSTRSGAYDNDLEDTSTPTYEYTNKPRRTTHTGGEFSDVFLKVASALDLSALSVSLP